MVIGMMSLVHWHFRRMVDHAYASASSDNTILLWEFEPLTKPMGSLIRRWTCKHRQDCNINRRSRFGQDTPDLNDDGTR